MIILSYLSYLVGLGLVIFLYLFYHSYALLFMIFMMIIAPVLSVFICNREKNRLSVDFSLAPREVSRGTAIEFPLHLYYDGLIPLINNSLTITVTHEMYDHTETFAFHVAVARGDNTLTLKFTPTHAGAYRFEISQLLIRDTFYFCQFVHPCEASHTLFVEPDRLELIGSFDSIGGVGLTELSDQEVKGTDSSQVIDTRTYRPGDKLSAIHWKLTARLNEIIVKEYGSLSSDDVFILVEPYLFPAPGTLEEKETDCDVLDEVFSLYYTLGLSLLTEKRPFTMAYYAPSAQEIVSLSVTTADELTTSLRTLFFAPVIRDADEARRMYSLVDNRTEAFVYIHQVKRLSGSYPKGKALLATSRAVASFVGGDL